MNSTNTMPPCLWNATFSKNKKLIRVENILYRPGALLSFFYRVGHSTLKRKILLTVKELNYYWLQWRLEGFCTFFDTTSTGPVTVQQQCSATSDRATVHNLSASVDKPPPPISLFWILTCAGPEDVEGVPPIVPVTFVGAFSGKHHRDFLLYLAERLSNIHLYKYL